MSDTNCTTQRISELIPEKLFSHFEYIKTEKIQEEDKRLFDYLNTVMIAANAIYEVIDKMEYLTEPYYLDNEKWAVILQQGMKTTLQELVKPKLASRANGVPYNNEFLLKEVIYPDYKKADQLINKCKQWSKRYFDIITFQTDEKNIGYPTIEVINYYHYLVENYCYQIQNPQRKKEYEILQQMKPLLIELHKLRPFQANQLIMNFFYMRPLNNGEFDIYLDNEILRNNGFFGK